MMNRTILVGRMTKDPELRKISSKSMVSSFTLALNNYYGSEQQVDYIQCVVWNKIAENVSKYCSKGSLIGVEGRLHSRSYEDSQGHMVYVVEVICDSVHFIATKGYQSKTYMEEEKQS